MGKAKQRRKARAAREQAAQEEAARRLVELVATLVLCAVLMVMQDQALRQRIRMGWHRAKSRALLGTARLLALQSASADQTGRPTGEVLWAAAALLADQARKADQAYETVRLAS